MADRAVVAHVDRDDRRWTLAAWVEMNTATIGRQASSRGVSDAVGEGATVRIEVGECAWCRTFAGEAVVGQDPLPPFHPNCTCTASAI
jgi:hypothetical protein